jgi:hypothetical protein
MKPTQMTTIKKRGKEKREKIELFLNRNHGLIDHVPPFAFLVSTCRDCYFEHYLRRVIRLRLETVPCMS